MQESDVTFVHTGDSEFHIKMNALSHYSCNETAITIQNIHRSEALEGINDFLRVAHEIRSELCELAWVVSI